MHYFLEASRIVRLVETDGVVEHRDSFEVPPAAAVSFDLPPEFDGRLARLSISSGQQPARAYLTPVRAARIEAAVGLVPEPEEEP